MVSIKIKRLEDDIEARVDWGSFNPQDPNYDKFMRICQDHFHETYKGNGTTRVTLFKNETIKWYKKTKPQLVENLALVEDWRFMNVGQYYWLMNKGAILNPNTFQWVSGKMTEIENIANKLAQENANKAKTPVVVKKESTPEELGQWLASELEELILTGEYAENSDTAYDLLRDTAPKPLIMRGCIDHLKLLVDEHLGYTNNEIKEGFGDKEKWSHYMDQYSSLLRLAETYFQNAKTVRKTRKSRKTRGGKTARLAKIAEKVSFSKRYDKLKLVSVAPAQIIGSKGALIYNTKTRKIGVYYAKDSEGLQIRGTTIYDYDKEKSTHKTLRNPEKQIEGFRDKSMKRCEIIIRDYIKAVAKTMNGRLNEHTIIMKTWK